MAGDHGGWHISIRTYQQVQEPALEGRQFGAAGCQVAAMRSGRECQRHIPDTFD
jgi:hypothetical protein